MEKPAKTDYPILDLLQRRWSPRAFADRPVEPQKLRRLFEAARWAASSFNEQPWRFIVATRDQPEAYAKLLSCLVERNQQWAQTAPVLMLQLVKTTFTKNGKPNRVASHDLGLAMGNLTVQATAMDLFLHQMGGIQLDRIREVYALPEDVDPVAGCALGYPGEPGRLPEEFRESEQAPRSRKPLKEVVFGERFGEPSPLVD